MPAKKKKFIDKKKAVTFHLVHRSQKDPLQADEDAPQHVLLEVPEKEKKAIKKEELHNYGIYFDDDYDYLQHLKDANEINDVGPGADIYRIDAKPKKNKDATIKLSSQLFGSELETDVGLLNKAVPLRGPQVDWDPDIVAALDDDFDYDNPDNQLDDDFILMANSDEPLENLPEQDDVQQPIFHPSFMGEAIYRPKIETVEDSDDQGDEDFASDEAEDDFSDGDDSGSNFFEEIETKSRFTNYSMSSAVIKRNEGLTLLDERFEKLYEQYDESEIGALDDEEIVGPISSSSKLLNSILDEVEGKAHKVSMKDIVRPAVDVDVATDEDSSNDELVTIEPKKENWDCESILSTYSTLYNHPKSISEPRKPRIQKTSESTLQNPAERGLTLKQIHQMNSEPLLKPNSLRGKEETPEEKRARKQAVKMAQKQRREDKKQNKLAFKSEEIRQKKEILNLKNNLQGLKIS